jgi:hypothetical protein
MRSDSRFHATRPKFRELDLLEWQLLGSGTQKWEFETDRVQRILEPTTGVEPVTY